MGKSSLFNRILGRRAAVVSDREGVTRDRHYQQAAWNHQQMMLIDTGGFLPDDSVDVLADSVRDQIFTALEDADLVLFMVDIRVGPQELDQQFARLVLKAGKKVILVANKAEKELDRSEGWAFLGLGLGEPRMVSALTGYAFRSLLDEMIALFPRQTRPQEEVPEESVIRFAVLGRPNAGKSTLMNRLLRQNRAVVSDIPGTTRDTIEEIFQWEGLKFSIADTAGLRRKAKVHDEVEVFSNMRTLESIRRSDVCVLVLDSTRGMEIQEFRIISQIRQAGKGLILVFNKWDILENKDHTSYDRIVKELVGRDPMLEWVPMIAISAKEGQRVHRVLQEIKLVYENGRRVLGRDRLAEVFARYATEHPHPMRGGKSVKLTRACQILVNPPVVAVETRYPDLVDESYQRYLLKAFFTEFSLSGAALRLNLIRRLDLRKDEELEYYSRYSDRLPTGVDSDRLLDREILEED